MKEKILDIITECKLDEITTDEATRQVLDLFAVSGSLSILMERGQCKFCKHWSKYSDGKMKCAFYGSMPRTSDGDKWCDIDIIKKFGFEFKTDNDR